MSNVQVQIGGNTVQVQVQSSGFARANAAVTAAAASATAAAASAASAAATLAAAALKANNLSDLASASTARTNLGVAIGTNVQAYSANLDEYAAVNPTAAGLALLDDADASAQRTTLGLGSIATQAASAVAITGGSIAGITDLAVADGGTGASSASAARDNLGLTIGTNVQAYDADLGAIAALTSAADKMPYATGAQTWALADLTSFARTLLATANNSAFLTALGQIASSFVGFVNTGTGAVTRTLQAWLRERPVSVLDYYDAGDGSDYGPAFGRALTASPRVFWPYNASGYTISSAVSRTLTQDVIVDWNGQQVTFSAAVDLAGATVADVSVTLAANPARYATTVQITGGASASVQAGDIINLQSSVLPFSDAPDAKQDAVRIRSVSGSGPYTLTLDSGLNFPWSSAESGITVSIFRPVKVTHLRPNFVITQTDGATVSKYAVRHTGLRDITITSPVIKGTYPFTRSTNIYRTGFQLYYCVGWTVTDGVYEALSYPVGVYGGTRNGIEVGSRARYCRHSHADVGGFASDYRLIGLQDEDSFVALSTHPAFRCYAEGFDVRNNTSLAAWRCMGGSLKNGYIHTTDSTTDTPQIHSWVPNSGFEYVYDDADFDIEGVTFDNPSRTAADVYVHYGRIVRVSNTKAIDVRIGSTVDQAIFGPGNRFSGGKAAPQSSLVLSPARVDGVLLLDGYLDGSVYHINPYKEIVAQSAKRLVCEGQVFRKTAQGTYAVRVHINGLAGVDPVYLQGRLALTGVVQHESAGFYSEIEKTYTFGVALGGGGFIKMSTTPIQTIGPATGASGTDITLSIANTAYTDGGSGGDSYISFDVAIDTSAGVSNPAFGLEYKLTLRETFRAT